MGLTLQDAAETGRAAWLANLTVAEKVWPIRQLHALYRLLLENRDELLEVCNQDFSPGPLFWEKELATLVDDIGALILSIEAQANPTAPQDTHFGKITTFAQPCGVSLILSTSRNPLRLALAPLAASIAARNVVVLSTTNRDGFWALLEQKAADYLDTFAIQVVGATVSEIRPEKFDQIHIIAEEDDKQKYSELCQFSHVNWHPASGSFNVAVVDDGPLDVARCAHEISSNLPNLTAIMIEKGHFQSLCDALCKSIRRDSSQTETPTLDLPNGHHLTSIVYTVDWTGSAAVYSAADVQSMLQSAQRAGAVLMIKLSSMEQCLDVLRHTARIAQASLLNPKSREHERYFQDWTQSSTVAFGFIPSPIPEVLANHSGAAAGYPVTTFPVSLFAQSRIEIVKPVSGTKDSPRAIREAYERRFPVPRKEHPGGRIDFFVQVDYALKAVGSVLGLCVLVGAWYTGKAVRTRYF